MEEGQEALKLNKALTATVEKMEEEKERREKEGDKARLEVVRLQESLAAVEKKLRQKEEEEEEEEEENDQLLSYKTRCGDLEEKVEEQGKRLVEQEAEIRALMVSHPPTHPPQETRAGKEETTHPPTHPLHTGQGCPRSGGGKSEVGGTGKGEGGSQHGGT